MDNAALYAAYSEELKQYESEYETSPSTALVKMANLYCKLGNTNFHDLWDAIELWFDACGDRKLLDDAVRDNPKMRGLQEIIESKSARIEFSGKEVP